MNTIINIALWTALFFVWVWAGNTISRKYGETMYRLIFCAFLLGIGVVNSLLHATYAAGLLTGIALASLAAVVYGVRRAYGGRVQVKIPGFHPIKTFRLWLKAVTIADKLAAGEYTVDQVVKTFMDAGCEVKVNTKRDVHLLSGPEKQIVDDEDPDPSYLYQEDMGFEERRAAYERGEFHFVGVRATAEVLIDGKEVKRVSSSGIWGVESDSDDEYNNTIYEEELYELGQTLITMGVPFAELKEATS